MYIWTVGDVWLLEDPGTCRPGRHLLPDAGPISELVQMIAPSDVQHARVMDVWRMVGNVPAIWCYACGEWGATLPARKGASPRRGMPAA